MIPSDDSQNESNIILYNDPEKLYIGNPFLFSKLDLSNVQFQIFCEMVAHIQKGDTEFNTYRLTVKDFAHRIGLNTTSIYQVIRTAARGMMQHIIRIGEDNGIDFKERVLVTGADYMRTKGYVDLKFNNDLKPYLLNLDGEFFTAHLEAIRRIRNITLGKLYWFCVRWINANMPVTIEVSKLRMITECVDKYDRYRDFKKEVLEKGIEVFREHGKVIYSYEEVREFPRNKKSEVIKVKIFIRRNTPTWEQPELDFKPAKKQLNNLENEKLIDEVFAKIDVWGFERDEVKKLIEKYSNVEHIFDKINYTKNKLQKGKIDNPKSYLKDILEKNPTLISAESIRNANLKKKQKTVEKETEKQAHLAPYQKQVEAFEEKFKLKQYEKLMEFFNEFPDVKTTVLEEMQTQYKIFYDAWKAKNPDGEIKIGGALYAVLLKFVSDKYHIFDKLQEELDEVKAILARESAKFE